jgi:hypothetical protein
MAGLAKAALQRCKILSIEQHRNLVVGQNFVVRFDHDGIAAAHRNGGCRLHRCRGVDRFVMQRYKVVGQRNIYRLDVRVFESDGPEERIECDRMLTPRAFMATRMPLRSPGAR